MDDTINVHKWRMGTDLWRGWTKIYPTETVVDLGRFTGKFPETTQSEKQK